MVLALISGLLALPALGETARELTPRRVSAQVNQQNLNALTDGRYATAWYAKKGWLEVELKQGETAGGVYVCHSRFAARHAVQVPDGAGGWRDVAVHEEGYLHQFTPLPGVDRFRLEIRDFDGEHMLNIAELHVLSEGERPDWVQEWGALSGKADLMLVAAHPDDEWIWFGGTLPYYATERGKRIQVVYLTCGAAQRANELLDGLWMGGIRNYPVIGPFKDVSAHDRQTIYGAWGGTKTLYPWLVRLIRRYQPDVLLSHDLNGEYGHAAHQIAGYACVNCLERAADPTFDEGSAAEHGVWQVPKLYLHYYPENRIEIGWQMPLSAFAGRTAFDVAGEALRKHKSQHPLSQDMREGGPYDCRVFGLVSFQVGPDTGRNDFFENIDESWE